MSERGRHKIHNRGAGKGPAPRPIKYDQYGPAHERIFGKWEHRTHRHFRMRKVYQ